ncbi:hypothetical protein ABTE00_20535, partial [Acinetobacter baumannii]
SYDIERTLPDAVTYIFQMSCEPQYLYGELRLTGGKQTYVFTLGSEQRRSDKFSVNGIVLGTEIPYQDNSTLHRRFV